MYACQLQRQYFTLETARQMLEFLEFLDVVSHEIAPKTNAKNEQSKASFAPKEDYFQEKLTNPAKETPKNLTHVQIDMLKDMCVQKESKEASKRFQQKKELEVFRILCFVSQFEKKYQIKISCLSYWVAYLVYFHLVLEIYGKKNGTTGMLICQSTF